MIVDPAGMPGLMQMTSPTYLESQAVVHKFGAPAHNRKHEKEDFRLSMPFRPFQEKKSAFLPPVESSSVRMVADNGENRPTQESSGMSTENKRRKRGAEVN